MMTGKGLNDIFKDKTKVKGKQPLLPWKDTTVVGKEGKDILAVRFVRRTISISVNFDSDRWPAGSPERKHCVVIFATEKWIRLRPKR